MHIRITKSFTVPASPRPLITGELLDLPDDIAQKWVDEGRAQLWTLTGTPPVLSSVSPTPPKSKREKAVRT
jgi:hypothetical protein